MLRCTKAHSVLRNSNLLIWKFLSVSWTSQGQSSSIHALFGLRRHTNLSKPKLTALACYWVSDVTSDEDFWLGANWLVAKVLRKPISYHQFTLLYELDTLRLMYSTNDNICVWLARPNCHLPHYFGETGTTTPRNRWLSIRFVPLTLSFFFFFFFKVLFFQSRSLAEGSFLLEFCL